MMSVAIATIVTGGLWVCTQREWDKIYIKGEQGISRYEDAVLIVCAIEYSVALVLYLIPTLCFNCHAGRPQTITQQCRVIIRFHLLVQWYFVILFFLLLSFLTPPNNSRDLCGVTVHNCVSNSHLDISLKYTIGICKEACLNTKMPLRKLSKVLLTRHCLF